MTTVLPTAPTIHTTARRARPVASTLHDDLARARWLANLLDARFSVAGIRFGLDALVGLIPGIGDTLTTIAGAYPLWVARRHGLGTAVQVRMAANLGADWLIGLLPIIGDVADIGFKAHLRNLRLLEKACAESAGQPFSR